MKSIKFYTLGCKVNQYETQEMRERILESGFKEVDKHEKAQVVVINTCTVTHRADSESLNLLRRSGREIPRPRIIVTGCMSELDKEKIKKTDPDAVIIKNKDKSSLPKYLFGPSGPNGLNGLADKGISYFSGRTRAFLKIQDGCNNFCSYCKVPLARGRSRSRPLRNIISEAEKLVKNGFKEIVLTGICLGAYASGEPGGLISLINALEKIEGLLRIRLSSIEAPDISEGLIVKIKESAKLCRHLHIPLQSGDNKILKRMNRKYRRKDYLGLVRKIRKSIPEAAITTDVMAGFPGESELNFRSTVDLIKKIMPLKAHIFGYSKREGTAACNFKDEVEPSLIKERLLRLKEVADTCAFNYKKQFLNRNMQVLIEGRNKDGFWEGHTGNYLKIAVKSRRNLKNSLVTLRLKDVLKEYIPAVFS